MIPEGIPAPVATEPLPAKRIKRNMAELLFFLIISSGCAFFAERADRKFEEVLPIMCLGITMILFLFGIAGILNAGVYLVMAVSAVLWLDFFYNLIRKKDLKTIKRNLVTPGSLFFALVYFALVFLNKGKLAAEYDEFTHWIDCVKEMVYLNDFVTDPASGSMFASYPPSMALFQYFYQKTALLMNPGSGFTEWRCFHAFQILFLSAFLPFFSNLTFKKPFTVCVYYFTVIVMPLFYYACYSNILIDPFVGLIAGAGLSRIFLKQNKDRFYTMYMILLVCVLALAKDAGQYFALFIAVFYAADALSEGKKEGKISLKRIISAMLPFISILISRLLWKAEIVRSGTMVAFGGRIDFIGFGKLLLSGGGEGYKKITVSNFIDAFFEKRIGITALDIQINYFLIFFVNAFLLLVAWKLLSNREPVVKNLRRIMIFGALVQTVIYVYSLGATYISNFSEGEAMSLAAYNRYMSIGFLPLWIMILLSFLYYLSEYTDDNKIMLSSFALGLLLVSPMEDVTHFLMKRSVRYSIAYRQPYEELSQRIKESCEKGSRIALISQSPEEGEDYWVLNYSIRPERRIITSYTLSGDENGSPGMSAESAKKIFENNYDYVITYSLNDNFKQDYGELFKDRSEIASGNIYRVNDQTGLLERCK